jgi:hypothetical protein
MDSSVSLQDVANIVTFIAPGYFTLQVYSLIYAKKERDFSRLLIESIICSLPIVALSNLIWERLLGQQPVSSLSARYALLVLLVAIATGALITFLRVRWPVRNIAAWCGLGPPSEDFVKSQLLRIDAKDPQRNAVTVTLKSGSVFSGTVDQLSRYSQDGPKYYTFSHLAWFNAGSDTWDDREGSIIVERQEIEYIETPKLIR